MKDPQVEEVDGDGEDRGRIWEIGIDTYMPVKVILISKKKGAVCFGQAGELGTPTDCEVTYSVPLLALSGYMIL